MTANIQQNVLSGLQVRQAMRRNPLRLEPEQNLDLAISVMIKYKASSILISSGQEQDLGLLTKTDLTALYYAGLPLETVLADVFIAPILTCSAEESLENALSKMLDQGVKRIYVQDSEQGSIVGSMSYADIVGLLYRFCCRCDKSLFHSSKRPDLDKTLLVRDIMQQGAVSCAAGDNIGQALELLALQSFSALLVQDVQPGLPGVISKTDLILAYRHHIPLEAEIQDIASAPALSCHPEEPLVQALQRMILADVHRLFVSGQNTLEIQGVLSLTDAARARSGSCRACSASRLQ